MIETLLWLWIGIVAYGLGRGAFRRLMGGPREMEALCSWGLGYGLLTAGMIALGFAHAYYSGLVLGLLVLLSLILVWFHRREIRRTVPPASLKQLFAGRSRFEQFCLLLAVLICLRSYLGALTPEMRHDVLDYHINFPNLYRLQHGMYEIPWHVFSYMPSNVETLYTLSLLLSSDMLAKLTHYGFSLLCAGCIYSVGRRYLGRRVAVWAMLLWLLLPQVAYEASTAYIDLGVSMWAFLAVACLLRYFEALGAIRPAGQSEGPSGEREARRWLSWCTICR